MIAQIGNWIELSFWQLIVRMLSQARPLSGRIQAAKQVIAAQPLPRPLRSGWLIAIAGWALGLVVGFVFAFWW